MERKSPLPAFTKCVKNNVLPLREDRNLGFRGGVKNKTLTSSTIHQLNMKGGGTQHRRVLIKNPPLLPPVLDYSGCPNNHRFRTPYGLTPCRKAAFTLAEVLITLGIIGIVAAMTLPTLIQKQNDRQIVTGLKKSYSILSQALTKAQLKYGFFETWDLTTEGVTNTGGDAPAKMKEIYERIKPELKVIQECNNKAGCWHKGKSKNLYGTEIGRDSIGIGKDILIFRLADGINISIDDYTISQINNEFGYETNNTRYVFWVDANGDKKPNTIGRDIFPFILTNKGLVPAGIHKIKIITATQKFPRIFRGLHVQLTFYRRVKLITKLDFIRKII